MLPIWPAGLGLVVEATGSPTGLPTAFGLVEPLGTVVLKTTMAGEGSSSLNPLVIDEIRVVGSRCGPFPPAIAALADGRIDPTALIQAEFALDRVEAAFDAASALGALKILVRP